MRTIFKSTIAAGALIGIAFASGAAQMVMPRNLVLAKESRVWLEGTSTVRSYKCNATKLDVAVSAETVADPAELVKSASVVVPVAALECGNGTMNEHMRKALKAEANPRISWKLNSYKVNGTAVAMNGLLTIAGKEKEIDISGTGTVDGNGTVRMKGSKQFKMSDFGVKPPSLMLGTMKVGDMVTVSFDLVLNP
jgi:polyisoprenoid-binding protein YceI